MIRFEDTLLLDPENTPIPLVDASAWALCVKVHSHPSVMRIGEVKDYRVTRGEINQTIYRQYITDNSNTSRLLKGVEIGRYCLHDKLSQGFREWFDEKKFLRTNTPRPISGRTRIATQRITGVDERLRVVATVISPPCYFADSTNSVSLSESSRYSLQYLLGLLNSCLIQWRFKITSTNNNVGTNEIESLPFRLINFDDPTDKTKYDRMVAFVDRMLDLHKQKQAVTSDATRARLAREINITEEKIDALVYQLYGLTDEEIKIVEGR